MAPLVPGSTAPYPLITSPATMPTPPALPAHTAVPTPPVAPAPPPQPQPPNTVGRRRNPHILAAFAYALPFVPALVLLARERRNRFVRLHAAQSLVFFLTLAVAQSALFVALVAAGGITPNLASDVLLGLIFYGIAAVLGLGGLILWLRLVADAAAGLVTPIPLLTRLADRMEGTLARMQGLLPR